MEAPGPLAVRGTPAELQALVGQRITAIRQRGKFLMIDLDRDAVVVNPMLTGRFQLARDASVKVPGKTAVVVGLGERPALARAKPPFARWTKGAAWLPADDGVPLIRYRDPTQMGKVYLLPAGVDRTVPGLGTDEIGPDADDPALSLEVWRERIRRHPGELKNLLRNQAFVAGIGNAYSDEVLHAAGLLAVPEAVYPGVRGSRHALRGDAHDARHRHRCAARARAPDVRDAGPRLPRGPHEGGPGVSAMRDADHGGQGWRVRDLVLPRLPALNGPRHGAARGSAPGSGQLEDLTDPEGPGVLDVVELGKDLPRRVVLERDAAQRVPALDLVGRRGAGGRLRRSYPASSWA